MQENNYTDFTGDKTGEEERKKDSKREYISEKHSYSLSMYFLKMLLVVIFQYQILLA